VRVAASFTQSRTPLSLRPTPSWPPSPQVWGLACGWVGAFDEAAVRGVLGSEGDERPIALIPIGYPAKLPQETPRRPLTEMVRRL
jgi:nitroreductase